MLLVSSGARLKLVASVLVRCEFAELKKEIRLFALLPVLLLVARLPWRARRAVSPVLGQVAALTMDELVFERSTLITLVEQAAGLAALRGMAPTPGEAVAFRRLPLPVVGVGVVFPARAELDCLFILSLGS